MGSKRKLFVVAVCLWSVELKAQSRVKEAGGFERLKTLARDWEAKGDDGKPFRTGIRPVSNGTALEETVQTAQDNQMVTLYIADGDHVALTHYCSMGNQPHKRRSFR